MNKYEFTVSGQLLYGQSWKSDMARMLNFSTQGKYVLKLSKGERSITNDVNQQIIQELQRKSALFMQAAAFLESPYKIETVIDEQMCLLINQEGLYQVSKSKLAEYLPCIVLDNLKIKGQILANYHLAQDHAFQNAVIQESFTNAQSTNYYDALKNALFNYLSLPTSAVDAVLKLKLE